MILFVVRVLRTQATVPAFVLALRCELLEGQLRAYKDRGVRPKIDEDQRLLWALLVDVWPDWRSALHFVQPQTVLRWRRQRFWKRWFRRKGHSGGRPRIPRAHIRLIRQISAQHPEWGEDRIAQELSLKLGVEHSASTIRRYLERPRGRGGDSWRKFVRRHAASLVGVDFAVVPVGWLTRAYVFVVLAVDTREVLLAAVTTRPTLAWVEGQLGRVLRENPARKLILHDNDGIYGQYRRVREVAGRRVRCQLDAWLFEALGCRGLPTPYGAPNASAHVERFIGSLRRECLNHYVFVSEGQLQRVVDEYVRFYNDCRPHQGLGGIPNEAHEPRGPPEVTPESGRLVGRPVLGGLQHDYRLAA